MQNSSTIFEIVRDCCPQKTTNRKRIALNPGSIEQKNDFSCHKTVLN